MASKSAGVLERVSMPLAVEVPGVVVDASAEPMLTPETRPLVSQLLDLLIHESDRRRVTWDRIRLRGFVDPEEADRTLVIVQYVRLSVEQADAFWDSLEAPLQRWVEGLPEHDSERVRRQISVRVRSSIGHA